jgi:hypothetical protein
MLPAFRKIFKDFDAKVLLCAMTNTFAELIYERGGSDEPLNRVFSDFPALPAAIREQVPDCHAKIKAEIAAVRQDGFTLDAVICSMVGALVSLYHALDFSEPEIEDAKEALIAYMNEAQRVSIN